MGKRKIHKFVKIEDNNSRNVTYCKRKKGLIKKAMELSLLCHQQVYLSIFDQERQKLVIYCTSENYNGKVAWKAEQSDLTKCSHYEHYTNNSYKEMSQRIKIEKKLVMSPSMQIFRVGPQENQTDEEDEKQNSQKNKIKLSIIQKRIDQNEDC